MKRIFLLFFLMLAACGEEKPSGSESLRVVATLPPFYSFAAGLLDGVAEPELLLHGSRDPHLMQLKPSDIRRLEEADVIFWGGEALEPEIAKMLKDYKNKTIIDLSKAPGMEMYPLRRTEVPGLTRQRHADESLPQDPHYWLDPHTNAARIVNYMANALSQQWPDVDQVAKIRINEEQWVKNLTEVHLALQEAVRVFHERNMPLLRLSSGHDATQYIEKRYKIRIFFFVSPHGEGQLSVARIKALRGMMKGGQRVCVLLDPSYSEEQIRNVSGEGELFMVPFDSEGMMLEQGSDIYLRIMRQLADGIRACAETAPAEGGSKQRWNE